MTTPLDLRRHCWAASNFVDENGCGYTCILPVLHDGPCRYESDAVIRVAFNSWADEALGVEPEVA